MSDEYGPLAAALSKAQAAFPPIQRDKEVTVSLKSGASYKFKYAPLDTIFAAVRKPLADNGLAIVQLLDDGELVTMLLHEGGARLAGRIALPGHENQTVQELGSAITYLRRYSLQAILGIATEEDDDGNRASGNDARPTRTTAKAPDKPADAGPSGLVGIVATKGGQDFQLRQDPDGPALPFRIKEGDQSVIVVAHGNDAEDLYLIKAAAIGARATVWGTFTDESFVKNGKDVNYRALQLSRIVGPDWEIPAPQDARPAEPDLSDAEMDGIFAAVPKAAEVA